MAAQQLSLGLRMDGDASFENYFVSAANALLLDQLQRQSVGDGAQWLFVHGHAGRSHLLQASCRRADCLGRYARYIPLKDVATYPAAELLAGAEALDLLCLDDFCAVAGDNQWERALFNLYNAALESGTAILISASAPVQDLPIALADLKSRLQSFSSYRVSALDDGELMSAFCWRAAQRGIAIDDRASEYVFARCQRDLSRLLDVLERLDRAGLERQRKVTVPFIREVMGW